MAGGKKERGRSVTSFINIAIPILGGIFIATAIISFLSGIRARSQSTHSAYGWGRQEARQTMQIAFLRSFGLLIIGFIILGVYGLAVLPDDITIPDTLPTPTITQTVPATATVAVAPIGPTATVIVPITIPIPSATASVPLLPSPTATNAPTLTPPPTATAVPSAIVNSPVGLYLREAPGGVQEVELLVNGAVLILLPGRETIDGVEWQQVRTSTGNEGWVAVQFIIYQ